MTNEKVIIDYIKTMIVDSLKRYGDDFWIYDINEYNSGESMLIIDIRYKSYCKSSKQIEVFKDVVHISLLNLISFVYERIEKS